MEAKKFPSDTRSVAFDVRKLEAYQRELGYQRAVYLELTTRPQWQWIGRDRELRPVAEHRAGDSVAAT